MAKYLILHYDGDEDFRNLLCIDLKSRKLIENKKPRIVTIIQKNPSLLDENDQTVKVVSKSLKRKGFDQIRFVNLFSFRAKQPKILNEALKINEYEMVVGETNNEIIGSAVQSSDLVLVAWGMPNGIYKALYDRRIKEVITLLKGSSLSCMGQTHESGYPKHGLKWRKIDTIVPFEY